MAHITSRKHAARPLPSRLTHTTAALALMAPALAMAQASEPAAALPAVKVKAAAENDYKADKSVSPKLNQPLVDTPQTITVIKKELIQEQGGTTLSEALRNTPGITFQMGENGNTQTGDSIFMRGFDTQNSIFVDGIRDVGSISRDVFNLEQVEVVKGPSGADIGRGSPTGYINLATKLPTLEDLNAGTITLGTADRKRLTADLNRAVPALGAGSALRLNVMAQNNGVDGRDEVKNESWGFAPSLALGLGTPTRVFLYYLHMDQDNVPDGGVPTFGLPGYRYSADHHTVMDPAGVTSLAAPDSSNFYGSTGDYNRIKADMFTARFEHDLKPGVVVRNVSRFGRTEQKYVLTGVNAVNIGNSTTATNGTVTPPPAGVTFGDPNSWVVARSRQAKDQENLILTNQTSVNADFEAAGMQHSVVSGLEFMQERQSSSSYGTTTAPAANLYNPNPNVSLNIPVATGRGTGETTTVGLYAFDTLKVSEAFRLNGGLRLDRYRTTYEATGAQPLGKGDLLSTWKLGALWKPATNGSIYIAYGTAERPPGSDGGTLSSSGTSNNNPNVDPSKATNIELGTKWELLDNRLAVTAAIYRATNKNDVVATDAVTGITSLGKKRVDGIELATSGMLTSAWQVSAGLALMDTEVEVTNNASQAGQPLPWSPKVAFTSWTTYRLPMGLTIGGGARYQGEAKRNSNAEAVNNASTGAGLDTLPDYWVLDAMATYDVTKNLSLQLNIYNLTDKFYMQSMNSGGSRYTLGTPRAASLTANLRF